ncbi:hypothetical protein [Spirosoma agri]|uniref:Uncharacterized protein n=1 Tax=Spirosoma agri TaxID=1987381 RepID=A0A6M0IHR7_9BACT|nr:hypothetical protein [Spirosoma agri]NEU67417.1 hypothetical protein [Spirosoma agri]
MQIPYIIDLANRSKRLVFVGCTHVRDSTDQQFTTLQRLFSELNPQVGFNEGGQLKQSQHYPSLHKAAFQTAETGVMKYLCDQAGIALVNGDTPDSLEFSLALSYYPKQELYLYYVMERIVIPYLSLGNQQPAFEPYFDEVVGSFVREGFPLATSEKSLRYFKVLYQQYMNRPFELALTQAVEQFDYTNGGSCHFCEIGRRSKMIRDSVLLTKLDRTLDRYDRVIVTFGCGHALAVEPALRELVNKKRR